MYRTSTIKLVAEVDGLDDEEAIKSFDEFVIAIMAIVDSTPYGVELIEQEDY